MSKALKLQGKMGGDQLIENQPARRAAALGAASTPTPLAFPARVPAARDPRGGIARAFPLPLSERPYGVSESATGAGV